MDPASYLIEWTPGANVLPISLDPVVDPDDETFISAADIRESLTTAAAGHDVDWSLPVIGGDPALALGRLAAAVGASIIVIGARRPASRVHGESG